MVFMQTMFAWLSCCARGTTFAAELWEDSAHPAAISCVVFGGAALAVGDFSAAAAIERLGVAVGGPVCFSCMLMCGSLGDYLLEGSAHPYLFFGGVTGCIGAVLADSQSHPRRPRLPLPLASADAAAATAPAAAIETPTTQAACDVELSGNKSSPGSPGSPESLSFAPTSESSADVLSNESSQRSTTKFAAPPSASASMASQPRPNEFRLGMAVAICGGIIGGLWTVLSTLASRVHQLSPFSLLFYFHLGESMFIIPVVLIYGRLFGGVMSIRALRSQVSSLTRRQAFWSSAAGLCIALGYLFYFATKGSVPRQVAYAFGCSAGVTGMVWGIAYFAEYKGAARWKKMLLLLAICLYPSSISLIALSLK